MDNQSMMSMRPGRYPQCREGTQYRTLHLLHSRGRLDTAHNQSMGRNLDLLGLLRREDMTSILQQSVILRGRHSLLHRTASLDRCRYRSSQLGSAYTQSPQMVRNILHHTACTV